jgi:inorganic triphosphatase YgiF
MQTSEAADAGSASAGPTDSAWASATLRPVVLDSSMLRLLAPPDAIGLLLEAPVIAQHIRSRGVVRRLDAVYYDTADQLLFGSGLSLRVQRQGRRFIQRLKQHRARQHAPVGSQGDLAGDLAGELAWDVPVDSALPDLSRLAGAGITGPTASLLERISTLPLLAIFETSLRRQVRRLELPGALLDATFDEGVITAGARQDVLEDITLALRSGEAGILHDVGMRLMEVAPLRVSTSSKVMRGYALASGAPPAAEKAGRSALSRDLTADDMVAAVIAGCLAHLQANQAVAEDGRNPDGVHQVRVALRRLRTALSLFRREIPSAMMRGLSAEAKWAADEFGPARSWDVFLATTLTRPEQLQNENADFAGLRQAVEAPRVAAYAAVRAALGAPRHGHLQLSLGQWIARRGWRNEVGSEGLVLLAEPAPVMAVRVLNRLHRKALRRGRQFRQLSPTERHELRITLKKLRYAAEFFLPLVGETSQARHYLRRLGNLQDALGLDHDAATTRPLLEEIGRDSRSCGVHQAIGIVAGWQARDTLAAGETLKRQWKRFKALPPFWDEASLPAERKSATVVSPQ